MPRISSTHSLYPGYNILPYHITAPLIKRYSWLTRLVTAYNGQEVSEPLRALPRIHYTLRYSIRDRKHTGVRAEINDAVRGRWLVPMWDFATRASATGEVRPEFLQAYPLQTVLLVIAGDRTWFLTLVDRLGSTLVFPRDTIPANAHVVPLRTGVIDGDPTIGLLPRATTISITFRLTEKEFEPDVTAPTQYSGHDFDPTMPVPLMAVGGNVPGTLLAREVITDYSIGPVTKSAPWIKSKGGLNWNWLLDLESTDHVKFIDFLYRRQGRYRPFWLPSFKADLQIVGQYPLQIRSDRVLDQLLTKMGRIVLVTKDKWYPIEIASVGVGSGTHRNIATILSSSVFPPHSETVRMACFLHLYRLRADTISTSVSQALLSSSTPILEIIDPIMPDTSFVSPAPTEGVIRRVPPSEISLPEGGSLTLAGDTDKPRGSRSWISREATFNYWTQQSIFDVPTSTTAASGIDITETLPAQHRWTYLLADQTTPTMPTQETTFVPLVCMTGTRNYTYVMLSFQTSGTPDEGLWYRVYRYRYGVSSTAGDYEFPTFTDGSPVFRQTSGRIVGEVLQTHVTDESHMFVSDDDRTMWIAEWTSLNDTLTLRKLVLQSSATEDTASGFPPVNQFLEDVSARATMTRTGLVDTRAQAAFCFWGDKFIFPWPGNKLRITNSALTAPADIDLPSNFGFVSMLQTADTVWLASDSTSVGTLGRPSAVTYTGYIWYAFRAYELVTDNRLIRLPTLDFPHFNGSAIGSLTTGPGTRYDLRADGGLQVTDDVPRDPHTVARWQ